MSRAVFKCLIGGFIAALVTGCSAGGGAPLSALPPSKPASSAFADMEVRDALRVPSATITDAGLTEDFAADAVGGAAAGWTVIAGKWSVCGSGAAHAYCQPTTGRAVSLIGPATWTDYTVSASVADSNVSLGAVALIGRARDASTYYQLALSAQHGGSKPYWSIAKLVAGRYTVLAAGPLAPPDTNPNYGLRLVFAGKNITASVAFDGGMAYKNLATAIDSDIPCGPVGLSTSGTAVARFSNVTATLARPSLVSESAVASASFLDSIGMNALFVPPAYNQNIRSLIGSLGVRHYRIAASNVVAGTPYVSSLTDLYTSYGITFDVLTNRYMPAAQVVSAVQLLPAGSVDSVEGPNEEDCPSEGVYADANFAVDLPVYMKALYAAMKSNPATSRITVIGPSLCHATSYAAVAGLSGYVDAGNMHDYFAGFNPGSPGWGPGGYSFAPALRYGNIAWNVAMAGQATGTKPVIATETGFCTARLHGCLPLDVQAKYVPRLFLEQYRYHVSRTFMFKLVISNAQTGLGSLGIVSSSGVPNPAYTALAGMISVLRDSGFTSPPVGYDWALTGQTTGVDHVLMRKADGTLIVPLWIEAPSFDPNADGGLGTGMPVPQQAVLANFAQTAGSGILWTCNPGTGVWSSKVLTMTSGAFSVNVTDTVSILAFKPS